jgi:predicted DCC family thiol-disulfide oxidoreductase YuxK
MSEETGPVLLYDGLCGFCDGAVRMVLKVDRRRLFRFAPLASDFARGVLSIHPELEGIDSIVLVEPREEGLGRGVWVRSDAFIQTARYLGGAWRLLTLFALVPRPLRDWAYDAFAGRRYRIFGRFEACPIPPPEVRSRFLD